MLTKIISSKLFEDQFCKLKFAELRKVINDEDNETGYGLDFFDYERIKGLGSYEKTLSVKRAQKLLGLRRKRK